MKLGVRTSTMSEVMFRKVAEAPGHDLYPTRQCMTATERARPEPPRTKMGSLVVNLQEWGPQEH